MCSSDLLLLRWFRYLENLLSEDDSTWFVEKMTIADIAIWRLLGWLTSGIIDGIPTSIINFVILVDETSINCENIAANQIRILGFSILIANP